MRYPSKSMAAVAAVTMLTVVGCGSSVGEGGNDDKSLTLGFLGPSTGPYAIYGAEMKKSFDLYLKLHDNELGGWKIETVEGDEGAGGAEAVATAQRLIRREKADLVTGVASSGTAVAIAPAFDAADVPLIISVAGADALLAKPSDNVWKAGGMTAIQAAYSFGRWKGENAPDEKVFTILPDYAGGHEILAGYNKGAEDSGGAALVGERFYPLGTTTDFQPYLEALNQSGADSLFSMPAGSAAPFLQQFRQFTEEIEYTTMGGIYSPNVLKEVGDLAVGVADSYYYSWTLDNPENKEFVEAFEQEYGAKPAGEAVGQWEAMIVLDEALSNLEDEPSSENIADAMTSVGDVSTPAGSFILDPEHHLPVRMGKLFAIEEQPDGTFAEVYQNDLVEVGYVSVSAE